MSENTPDNVLVERTQQGDQAAFGLLVEKYQHRLAKLVSRYIYDSAEVEDVCQEAFIKAYRALPKFRGDSAFYTWLYRIARNRAVSRVREWKKAQGWRLESLAFPRLTEVGARRERTVVGHTANRESCSRRSTAATWL